MMYCKLAVLTVALLLGGCGGGGDDAGTPIFPQGSDSGGSSGGSSLGGSPSGGSGGSSDGGSSAGGEGETSTADAQGFFNGRTSNSYDFSTVILETGEFWGIYSRSGVIYGVVHGRSSASGRQFRGAGYDFYLPAGTRTDSSFFGSYVPKSSITGTVSPQSTTFTGTYDKSYDAAANIKEVVGTWNGNVASQAGVQRAAVTVGANGGFVGSVSTCHYRGTVRPRASGKAVFDLSIRFATTGCLFNGETLKGIAVVNKAGGQKSLVTAALLPDGTNGFLAAARQ